jgi:DNA invertase Pin-like site-specific DNA recombinase
MVAYCKKNQVSAILVHKLDRFSRNRDESILFKGLLRKHGVVVKSITENYDPDTPQGFLYEGMIEVINQFYSMNLATETLKGMRENAERANFNGGRVPYGYRVEKVDDGKGREHGKLVLGPDEEVRVVRYIFDLAVNHGLGNKSIARELNREGIPAPRSKHWTNSTISTILMNRTYVGDQVWYKTKKVGRDGRERTEADEHIVTPNAHPAIVERELFEKRAALAKGRSFDVTKRMDHHVDYLLARLIRCEHCGANFSGRKNMRLDRQTGTRHPVYAYYCNSYQTKGPEVCPSLPLAKDWIEGVVLEVIKNRLLGEKAWGQVKELVAAKIEARRRTYGQSPKAIDAKIGEIDRRIQNFYRAIGSGCDPVAMREQIAEANRLKFELEEEARIVRGSDYYVRSLEQNMRELGRVREAFRQEWDTLRPGVQRKVVSRFVREIRVVNRKDLHIRYCVPFDNMGLKLLVDEMEAANMPIEVDGSEWVQPGTKGGAISLLEQLPALQALSSVQAPGGAP